MNKTLHIVGFSGGIDSQACARWVLNREDNVLLMNSDAGGNEHPITTAFIRAYSDSIYPVQMVSPLIRDLEGHGTRPGAIRDRRNEFDENAVMRFDDLAYIKGRFPSRKAQFCTQHLKLAPQRRWLRENMPSGVSRIVRYSGVRRSESQKRRRAKAVGHDEYFDCEMRQPLVDWTKQMAFDYIKAHGEPINELYTLGFNRIGCAPCINANKADILAWHQRFPEMLDKVRAWEQRVGYTFFGPIVPGMKINWVDDVVRWAKTARGGKQFSLLPLIERPACESKYGLCE